MNLKKKIKKFHFRRFWMPFKKSFRWGEFFQNSKNSPYLNDVRIWRFLPGKNFFYKCPEISPSHDCNDLKKEGIHPLVLSIMF